jgi:hypothetical protein
VMAHEMSHVQNYDTRVSMIVFGRRRDRLHRRPLPALRLLWGGRGNDRNGGGGGGGSPGLASDERHIATIQSIRPWSPPASRPQSHGVDTWPCLPGMTAQRAGAAGVNRKTAVRRLCGSWRLVIGAAGSPDPVGRINHQHHHQ